MATPNQQSHTGNSTRSSSTPPWPSLESMGISRGQMGLALGATAAGLMIGLAGTVGRKVAVQTASGMKGEWDQMLTADHQAIMVLFDKFEQTTETQTGKRASLLLKLKHMLTKHALEEENVIYPALASVENSDMVAEITDHAQMKRALYELDKMDKASPRFMARIVELRNLIREHAEEEERELFPKLRRSMTPEECQLLTKKLWKEGLTAA